MRANAISKKISDIEEEIKEIKKELHLETKKKSNPLKLLDIFGSWEGEIDTFLDELYKKRAKRGRSYERLSSRY